MTTPTVEVHLGADELAAALREDARRGLTSSPKELPPKWFYDERGSELFEAITELPEYYPTRAEREILERHSLEICAAAGDPATLIELGSGSAAKTRVLLDGMRDAGCLEAYAPVDISEQITRDAAGAIASRYRITVHGLVCDFDRDLERIPLGGPRVIALLGGTIGNFEPAQRASFLARIANLLGDVWEWTSSDFVAYPGFRAFPYPEYSEVFFGDTFKVLRGGAWATRRDVIRTSFRNWDLLERRQIFAGVRCARDA